jgi:exodeoxyribonuclease VII small subunit
MATKKAKAKSFEDSMKRLEEIVQTLESGTLSLEETVALYKEGTELSNYCGSVLKKAEQEVKKISETPDGEFTLEDFPEAKA